MYYKLIISSQKAYGKGKIIMEDLTMLENLFQVKKSENLQEYIHHIGVHRNVIYCIKN